MKKLSEIKLNEPIFDRVQEIPVLQKNKELCQEIVVNGVATTVFDFVTLLINSIVITKWDNKFEARFRYDGVDTSLEIYSTFQKAVKDIKRLRDTTEARLLAYLADQIPTRFKEVYDGSQHSLSKYTKDATEKTLQDQTRFYNGLTFDIFILEQPEKECFAIELVEDFKKPLNHLFAVALAVNDNGDQRLAAWDNKEWEKFYKQSTYIG